MFIFMWRNCVEQVHFEINLLCFQQIAFFSLKLAHSERSNFSKCNNNDCLLVRCLNATLEHLSSFFEILNTSICLHEG